MNIECGECGKIFNESKIKSGSKDEHGTRGECPECGADEVEFADVENLMHNV